MFINSCIFIYMGIFVCKICQKECKGILGLRSHNALQHKITSEDTYIDYMLNGVKPKCECGCGKETSFITIGKGFSKFIQSHHNRVPGKNNYHKNPETHKKALATQKKNWKEGKYKGWWESDDEDTRKKIEGIKEKLRNNKERGKKISNSLTGKPKTEECKKKISNTQKKRYKDNPELRKQMSKNRVIWMKKNSKVKTSNAENKFSDILESIGLIKDINFIHNHLISSIKTFFDFYVIDKRILIEVDGDFYHCNPNTIHKTPKYEIQEKNIINDKRKNTWCKNHNIPLLRYWEKDINERPEWVISDLKNRLQLK